MPSNRINEEHVGILRATLEIYDQVEDLWTRNDVQRTDKIFDRRTSKVRRTIDIFDTTSSTDAAQHTIYHDKIAYLGESISLIVFRPKGAKGAPRAKTEYALFNDTTGVYQPLSINQLLVFFVHPPRWFVLQTTLSQAIEYAKEARVRIETKLQVYEQRTLDSKE